VLDSRKGRERPSEIGCREDPDYDRRCGERQQYVSFFGGHTATTTTGAALPCARHRHADLFARGLADDIACGAALATAAVVFVTRLQAVGTGSATCQRGRYRR
jgi:hypothetical protein